MEISYFCQLAVTNTILVQGVKAKEFLQAHLTAQLNTKLEFFPTALCNVKGRVLATFYVNKITEQSYKLIFFSDLADLTMKFLGKTAPFSKVTLKKTENEFAIGLSLSPNLHFELEDALSCFEFTKELKLLHFDEKTKLSEITEMLINQNIKQRTSFDFYKELMSNHWLSVSQKTCKEFLPSRLNLIKNNVVSVNKGCYIGHEIIARMHFKSEDKYQIVTTNSPLSLDSGSSVIIDEKNIGVVLEKLGSEPQEVFYALSIRKDSLNLLKQ